MILFQNDFLRFEAEDENIFLIVVQSGLTMKEFGTYSDMVPRLKLTKFGAAKNALDTPSGKRVLIGTLKPEVEVSISSDEMTAHITLNMMPSDYEADKKSVVNAIMYSLKEEEITEGIKQEVFNSDLHVQTKILIAEGVPPTHGDDAILEYYEFSKKKPTIKTDGKVNHYELELIDNVEKGEWLGKKIPPTLGEEGVSVKGNPVSAKSGRDYKLKFDPNTVNIKTDKSGVENLYAKINGAVKMKNSRICVDNHLIIHGDVEYTTGHIEFDGYVTVTGTVKDKFNVTATYDISINGPMGIGAVGLIESKKGSVLLKGGVNGKGVARIKAARDVFTKYANEAIIDAGSSIHVGLYSMDSILNAKKIILPPTVGRIIGGQAIAEHRIETGSIGNKFEKPTKIHVEGFERGSALEMLNYYKDKSEGLIKTINKLKRELEIFEKNLKKLDDRAMTTYEYMLIKYDNMITEVNDIKHEIQKLEDVLRTKGEGEVAISQSVFPKTTLEIKSQQRRIKDKTTGSFYVQDQTLHHNG
jgi:uncharacterized protein (DUF342 family)